MLYSFILATLLAIVHFTVATPPACLLAALINTPNPADTKAVCGNLQSAMLSNITSVCSGPNLQGAYDTYSSTCLLQGVTVAALPTSTSSGATATGTGSMTMTGTGTGSMATATGSSGSGSSATGAGATGSATSTSKGAAAGMPLPTAFVALPGVLAGVAAIMAM